MTWTTIADVDNEVVSTVNEGIRYSYLTCGIELQRQSIERLVALHERLRQLREECIAQQNEPFANAAFRAQLLTAGTARVLEMWVLLKEDHPAEAWDKLSEAQEKLQIAQRVLFDENTETLLEHLGNVESVVFPSQMFFSAAYTYTEAFCSICDGRYGECEHVAGRIYLGKICNRRIPRCVFVEASIVLFPKDKRCRVSEYSENGKVYCTITRRELAQDQPVDPSSRFVSGRIICHK